MTHSTRLLWLQSPLMRCPETGEPVAWRETTLFVHFETQTAMMRLELGYCRNIETYLAELPEVDEALDDAGFDLTEARSFSIDDAPVEAEVWMGATLGAIPWEAYAAGMGMAGEWREQPVPSVQALLAMPQARETWMIAQAPGTYHLDERDKPTLSYVGLVVTEDGLIRGFSLQDHPLGAPELRELVARGCAAAPGGLPAARPRTVLVDDPFVAEGLGEALKGLGIKVEVGDVSPALEALGMLKETLEPEPVPSYFAHYSEREVKAFFDAAKRFFSARPWEVFAADRFLAFRLDEGPWRYTTVMGQAGEQFGLAMFEGWLEVCRTVNNPESFMDILQAAASGTESLPKSLLASGGAESMTLSPFEAMAPEDADFLNRLKVKASWRKEFAAVHRYTPAGMERPRFEPALYTGLMKVIAERAQKVRGSRVTSLKASVETPAGKLEVRYPAKGDEGSGQDGYYRFRVPFRHGAASPTPERVLWATVEAPGEAKWHRVMAELTKAAKRYPEVFPWISRLGQGEYNLWLDQAPVKEPSPTVEQLAGQEGLTLSLDIDEEEPLELVAIPRPDQASIRVSFEE
jgi:hypothetical protein